MMSSYIVVRKNELNEKQRELLDAMSYASFIQEMTLRMADTEGVAVDEKERCVMGDVYQVGEMVDKLHQNKHEFKKLVWRDCNTFFQNKLRILTSEYHEYMNHLHKPEGRETRRSTEHQTYRKMLERERDTMKKILEITSVVSACLYDYEDGCY